MAVLRIATIVLSLLAAASAFCAPSPLLAADRALEVSIFIDYVGNHAYKFEQEENGVRHAFVYGITNRSGDDIDVRLDDEKIMDLWKGDGTIADGPDQDSSGLFHERSQFAPVLLVVNTKNLTGRQLQVTAAYLDVESSVADLEPFVSVNSGDFLECGNLGQFRPDLQLWNSGWGAVEEAKLTLNPDSQDVSGREDVIVDLGTFEQDRSVSLLEALRASGLDVEAVKAGKFTCASAASEDIAHCTKALRDAGIFGNLSPAVFPYGSFLLAHMTGSFAYRWKDALGVTHQRQSPVSADIPLLAFEIGSAAVCHAASDIDRKFNTAKRPSHHYALGLDTDKPPEYLVRVIVSAGPPIERKFKTVKLSLERQNYRIPLPYTDQLEPKHVRRVGLSLEADKSSQHIFRVVLQLSDGTTAVSPKIDLLYFMPRFAYTN